MYSQFQRPAIGSMYTGISVRQDHGESVHVFHALSKSRLQPNTGKKTKTNELIHIDGD